MAHVTTSALDVEWYMNVGVTAAKVDSKMANVFYVPKGYHN
jgi:hypothetical protein